MLWKRHVARCGKVTSWCADGRHVASRGKALLFSMAVMSARSMHGSFPCVWMGRKYRRFHSISAMWIPRLSSGERPPGWLPRRIYFFQRWHSQLNEKLPHPHPNLYILYDIIQSKATDLPFYREKNVNICRGFFWLGGSPIFPHQTRFKLSCSVPPLVDPM